MQITSLNFLKPIIISGCLLFSFSAYAEHAGMVDMVDGNASRTDLTGIKSVLHKNDPVESGDTLETAANTELHIKMSDAGLISLRPNAIMKIDEYRADGEDTDISVMSVIRGAMRSVTGFIGKAKPSAVRFRTENATIGIRGTDQEIIYVPEADAQGDQTAGTHHVVYEGKTSFESDQGKLDVSAGESAFIDNKSHQPRFHAQLPDFIQNRRLRHENRIDDYNRNIRDHIERMLHQRHMIRPNEHFEHFLERRRSIANINNTERHENMGRTFDAQSARETIREQRISEKQERRGLKRKRDY